MNSSLIIIRKKTLRYICLLVWIGAFSGAVWRTADCVVRYYWGVKSGIMLEGELVQGLLPAELARKIQQIACLYERDPSDAIYFTETGEIIPDKMGVRINLRDTIEKVFSASPNTHAHISTLVIKPTITQDFFSPVFSGPQHKKEVSLTFNVDWGEEYLPALLGVLDKNAIKATFFFTGAWAKQFPDLVKRISSHGHEIANHGYTHAHVKMLGRDELRELIKKNEYLLKQICGRSALLFAPPFGEWNENVVTTAGNLGYRTILWSIDAIDWERPAPSIIIKRVIPKLNNGAIILMHPTDPTVKALPEIILAIKAKGLRCEMVSELLKE